jgi:hypothetical protein
MKNQSVTENKNDTKAAMRISINDRSTFSFILTSGICDELSLLLCTTVVRI